MYNEAWGDPAKLMDYFTIVHGYNKDVAKGHVDAHMQTFNK